MTVQVKRRLLGFLGLSNPVHPYIIRAHGLRRTILRSDERMREDYLKKTAKPRLHIGGGWHRLEGWLNTDLDLIPNVMRMDATLGFPFEEGTFHCVYTEHMIEHVSYTEGLQMLRECYRVMRDGGVIRVVTPDLAAIIGLYKGELCPDRQEYLSWFCKTFVQEWPPNATSAINAMFRLWGHQFIYDEGTLANSMRAAGFRSLRRWALGESDYLELQNMENEQRYPEGLLNFESVAIEGLK